MCIFAAATLQCARQHLDESQLTATARPQRKSNALLDMIQLGIGRSTWSKLSNERKRCAAALGSSR
jgi:hypothetical protein